MPSAKQIAWRKKFAKLYGKKKKGAKSKSTPVKKTGKLYSGQGWKRVKVDGKLRTKYSKIEYVNAKNRKNAIELLNKKFKGYKKIEATYHSDITMDDVS